jgi:hypothetical protein
MKPNNIIQLLEKYKVVIPPIQRDYAHGRQTEKVNRVRERFLNAIVDVLSEEEVEKPLELDFIYGYTSQEMTGTRQQISFFKPLDGQQRLTTLFLIHWYIAAREGRISEAKSILSKFSYETRHSSQMFCDKLVNFEPEKNGKSINNQIVNQPWFFSTWLSDPTIASMLIVLKDIESKFSNIHDVWSKLTGDNPRIIFHLLAMEDLGLPDDLYIKMNARGKELTDYEYFKSQFHEILSLEKAKVFNEKIDKNWSDLFWSIFKDKKSPDIAKEVDAGFLSYFWYITDIVIAQNNISTDNNHWLAKIKTVYSNQDHVDYLFNCIDLFEAKEKDSPEYFSDLLYIEEGDFRGGRTRIFFSNPKVNLFHKCAEYYGYDGKSNNFAVGEQLLLYGIIYSELNNKSGLEGNIRRLRNLFSSSEDQLRKEYLQTFLYTDVETIIDSGELSSNSKLSKRQLQEEIIKENVIREHPHLAEHIYKLEDHALLRGNIAILNIDESLPTYANIFHAVFDSDIDYFQTSRALLTIGDYSQSWGKTKLRKYGNKSNFIWRQLLTQSESRPDFEYTKEILSEYLQLLKNDSSQTNESIISEYLSKYENNIELPLEWTYYYVKYTSFILWNNYQTNGFYYWEDKSTRPYEGIMMFRTQFNGRHWSPFLLEICTRNKKCTLGDYGDDLQFTHSDLILLIQNVNGGFRFRANDEESNLFLNDQINTGELEGDGMLRIEQNEDGIDLEDRIVKCDEFLNKIINK